MPLSLTNALPFDVSPIFAGAIWATAAEIIKAVLTRNILARFIIDLLPLQMQITHGLTLGPIGYSKKNFSRCMEYLEALLRGDKIQFRRQRVSCRRSQLSAPPRVASAFAVRPGDRRPVATDLRLSPIGATTTSLPN